MSFEFDTAVHFNNFRLPISDGELEITTERDWVFGVVNGTGQQNTSLFFRGMPWRKIDEFYNYFSRNEITWYNLYINKNKKIMKILKIVSYGLDSSEISSFNEPFPNYRYILKSFVTDVQETDDGIYKVFRDFHIKYFPGYIQDTQQR